DVMLVVFTFDNPAAKVAYIKAAQLESAPFVLFSSIQPAAPSPRPDGTPAVRSTKHKSKVFVHNKDAELYGRGNFVRSSHWDTADADLKNDGGIYVVLDHFCARANGSLVEPNAFQSQVEQLRRAGVLTGKLYGIKRDQTDKLGDKWVK